MSKKIYAVIGMWSGGLYLCDYHEESGQMTPIGLFGEKEIKCGQSFWDQKHQLLYATDEVSGRNALGGGGYATAWKIDSEKDTLSEFSRRCTLSENPSWICLEPSGAYALVTHFCAHWSGYTKIVQQPDGTYSSRVDVCDDALVLMRMNPDGSFGDVCDVVIHRGSGKPGPGATPHLHSVVCDPSGELFTVCDMGTDQVFSYRLNRKAGKLQFLDSFRAEDGAEPRLEVFDPNGQYLYTNNEGRPEVYSFRYSTSSGALERICVCPTLPQEMRPEGRPFSPSDLILSPDARYLYTTIRVADQISVLRVEKNGQVTRLQSVSSEGKKPKGIALSPDGEYLFSANGESGTVTQFRVNADGTLKYLSLYHPEMNTRRSYRSSFLT